MRIALIGYGKMGKMVEQYASQQGHEIIARITSSNKRSIHSIKEVDVFIDFTEGASVLETLKALVSLKKPLVIGTTGWNTDEAKAYASHMGILYSPNFSLGIALFHRLMQKAHSLFSPFYDVGGVEIHHNKKKDTPSGTALSLSNELPGLTFSSVRSGSHIGTHQIIFDAPEDTIEITHRARSREGFAKGAVEAAKWLQGKVGLYTFDDYIKDVL